jgi:hypothetical protein
MPRLVVGLCLSLAALVALGGSFVLRPRSESAEAAPADQPARDVFAADRDPGAPTPIAFDAVRAMGYLEEVCKIGPRVSGSEGMKQQQELLKKHFEAHGGKVEFQRFPARQKSQKQPVEMVNMIISWHPERKRRVILCAHYDTRPIADQEADPRKWREPFLSANDGGSGVALLMELARHLKDVKTSVGVDVVFFDGEEYIFDPAPTGDRYFIGSEHFANVYRGARSQKTYVAAILLDMIAGKNARFPAEPNSWVRAGALVQEVWKIAAELKCTAFEHQIGRVAVQDDHLSLLQVGIPAIDIIDFDYPHWHRLSDVPANCSAESMDQVARVLVAWLQRVK